MGRGVQWGGVGQWVGQWVVGEEYVTKRCGIIPLLPSLPKCMVRGERAVWRIQIFGIRIISLDPDPFQKWA